jgi:Domain of unknown function (DUF1992)
MTERKPAGMSFTSWIDQQISEAMERGDFDNLPGAGKPLPKHSDDAEAWALNWARREGGSTEEMLPTPLKLRKQSARLAEAAPALRSEEHVREACAELNERIMEWRKLPLGPPIFVPLVDEEKMVGLWRDAQSSAAGTQAEDAAPAAPRGRRRWRRSRG